MKQLYLICDTSVYRSSENNLLFENPFRQVYVTEDREIVHSCLKNGSRVFTFPQIQEVTSSDILLQMENENAKTSS
jgi:hypothetical protein